MEVRTIKKRLIDPTALKRYSLCGHIVVLTDDIDSAPTVDPVHATGGCYCHECENCTSGYCKIIGGHVPDGNFCGQGKVGKAGWISVHDRLPAPNVDVEVTFLRGNIRYYARGFRHEYSPFADGLWHIDYINRNMGGFECDFVDAWKPIEIEVFPHG